MTPALQADLAAVPSPASAGPSYLVFVPWPVIRGTGVNNAILGLAGAMSHRYRPEIVVYGWKKPPPGQRWLKLAAPEPPLRKLLGFGYYLLRSLRPLLRMARPAVALNAHYPGPELLPLLTLRKWRLLPKLILSVHGSDVPKRDQVSPRRLKLYTKLYAGADLVIACSGALAAQVKELSPAANVAAVWNGMAVPPPELYAQRPVAEKYLVSVAAFVWKKAHDVLLDAFVRVRERHPDLHLVLVGGTGPELANIERRIAELKLAENVRLITDIPHEAVWPWVRHAECFVIASREEPFGLAILEAALVQTPVVATRVGGVPEFLRDGIDGILCAPDDADQLGAAVLETLENRAAARERAEHFLEHARAFTWDAAFEKYRELAQLP